MDLNIFIALLAGFISFLSPCIFPIIPSYLGYIGAATYNEGYTKNKGAIFLILAFISGFTIVFCIMGIAFSSLGFAFKDYSVIISRISGALVIVLGLNTIFNFISVLDYEKKFNFRIKHKGFFSSLLLGMAFGAGWSPCIGPILASILFLAGNTSTLLNGIILLLFFSIGLGIPFLLSGIFISKFREKSQHVKKHLGKIRLGSGILIIVIGVSIFFNKLSNINIFLFQVATSFSNWYSINGFFYNIVLGIILILLSALILVKKRSVPVLILTIILFLIAILSITGMIHWDSIAMKYLTFQGI